MNEDIKILKTIVKIYNNYLQKGEEIDFAINERHLQAIENVLEERNSDKKQLKEILNKNLELSKKIKKLKVENKTLKEFASDVFNAEDISKEYIQKKKIKEILDKTEVMDYYTLPDVILDLEKLLEAKDEWIKRWMLQMLK